MIESYQLTISEDASEKLKRNSLTLTALSLPRKANPLRFFLPILKPKENDFWKWQAFGKIQILTMINFGKRYSNENHEEKLLSGKLLSF